MKAKETIAIIGATGKMGSAIARNLTKDDYRLILMSYDAEKLRRLKDSLLKDSKGSIDSGDCAREVSWEADIVIVASPQEADKDIAEKIREVATGKIVISISSPLNASQSNLMTGRETSAAEELQKLLPHSKVVKAFNASFAGDIDPTVDGVRADAFIAANNGNALEVVSRVLADAGFNPVVVGDLSVSRTLERTQHMLTRLKLKNKLNWLAGWKILKG